MARLAVLLLLFGIAAARAEVPSVFLVQNSGWMEPFFTDPASPFRPLLRALVEAGQTGRTVVAEFNQDGQVPGRRSPAVLFDGPYAAPAVAAAVEGLRLAARPGGRLADADLAEALTRTIAGVLEERPGIVWMVTNNKSSRNNDPAIERNTRAFAELIRSSPFLPVADAFPVRMPVTGRQYTERGLMIYAFAYGDEAAATLDRVVAAEPMRRLFTDPPFRLKRTDRPLLAFVPTGAAAPVVVGLTAGGGMLLSGVAASGGTVRLTGVLRSEYYPQVVNRAEVSAEWRLADRQASLPASVVPAALSPIAAGGSSGTLALELAVPAVGRRPGLAGLLARTEALRGELVLRLSGLSLGLEPDFTARMGEIAALDQLPEVFVDYRRVTGAEVAVPVVLAVRFSAWPLALLVGGATLGTLVLLGLLVVLLRPRRFVVEIGGVRRAVALRPFQTARFPAPGGGMLLVTGRPFGPPATRLERAVPAL